MNQPWKIVPIEPRKLSADTWDAIYAFYEALAVETEPDDPPPSREELRKLWVAPDAMLRYQRWLAFDEDGTLAGSGALSCLIEESPDYAALGSSGTMSIAVGSAWRRRGLGTAMLHAMVAAALADGIKTLQGDFQRECARGFLAKFGGVIAGEHSADALFRIDIAPLAERLFAAGAAQPPALPLPEPLRAAEIPSFTHYSVVTRLPDIARRTLAENPFPPETAERIQALIDEIPGGPIRPVRIESDAIGDWPGWIAPHIGKDWLEIPWFFAEEYFYLRILEATGYYSPGPWQGRDPYAEQKRLGLVSERARLRALAADLETALRLPAREWPAALERLLLADLWGNQSDLSLWPVQIGEGKAALTGEPADAEQRLDAEIAADLERVLDNDLEALLAFLRGLDPAKTRVDLLLDNAGYELAADLALADYLLESGRAAQVVLHAKTYPVFVSDALERDVHATIDYLLHEGNYAAHGEAIRLRERLIDGRLRLTSHPFWTSPLAMWQLPAGLLDDLRGADLLISKGDANYRRLLGDRHWPHETPFAAVVDYLPCAVLALRTLKSEIAVGLEPERLPANDPDWMINGRWGLVQFAPPSPREEGA